MTAAIVAAPGAPAAAAPETPALAPAPIPWLGIVAVLFGAIATTLTSRLTSSGLADIRGAIGAGFDEGAWITTAFGASQMLIGPATVWLGRAFGLRATLLAGCFFYGVAMLLIPYAPDLSWLIALQCVAGLGSGTFIPLTAAFVLLNLPPRLRPYGVAAYAMNIVVGLNVATVIEGWYSEHASWHWIFWQNACLAVPLFALFWFGMPRAKTDRAFLVGINVWALLLASAGLTLAYVALDQGDRLDWANSGLISALFLLSLALVGGFLVVESFLRKPGVDFAIATTRNIVIMGALIVLVRFLVSASNIIVPNFLLQVRGLRPLELGQTLLWVAFPQIVIAPATAWLLLRVDARPVMAVGVLLVAAACLLSAEMTPTWAESDFVVPLLLQAVGQALALTALVYFFALHFTPAGALTLGALIQVCRLFGGELGTAALTTFTRKSEQMHSNFVGTHVSAADALTNDRLLSYAAAVGNNTQGTGLADERALGLLAAGVRTQAYTLTYASAFLLCAAVALAALVLVFILRPPPAA